MAKTVDIYGMKKLRHCRPMFKFVFLIAVQVQRAI